MTGTVTSLQDTKEHQGLVRIRAFESLLAERCFRVQIDSTIGEELVVEFERGLTPPSKRLALFTLVGLTAVFLTSVLFRPPRGDYFSICAFKNFTGLPCPGCGLTHSFCALAKGDIVDAFSWNLMGPVLFVFLILLWTRSVGVLLNRATFVELFDRMTHRFNLVRAFAISFGVYGVVRIIYLLVFHPVTYHESPLSRLITGLVHN